MQAVFWIHKLLVLPDPDPLVRVMDPDLDTDPSTYNQQKIIRKTFILLFIDFYDFLSLKNDANVKVTDEKCRIRIRMSPKCHGSGTLMLYRGGRSSHRQLIY